MKDPADENEYRREIGIPYHPVITKQYVLPTPPVKRVYDMACRAIATRSTGDTWASYPRFGKTWTIDYLMQTLPDTFPDIVFISHIAKSHKIPYENKFFEELFRSSGFGEMSRAQRRDARSTLIRAWIVLGHSKKSRCIVFIGDEMQRLHQQELTWLADASNELIAERVWFSALFFGQPQLAIMRDILLTDGRGDLVGRFLSNLHAFDGIRTATELEEVLANFDDPNTTQSPDLETVCYSEYFFRRAFSAGWRLKNDALVIWKEFLRIASHSRTARGATNPSAEGLNIGMQWIANTIANAFSSNYEKDSESFRFTTEDWATAVALSGFAGSLGVTYEVGGSPLGKGKEGKANHGSA